MDTVGQTQIEFPRVTGYRVAEGRRVAASFEDHSTKTIARRTAPRRTLDKAARRASDRLQVLSETSWRVIGGIMTGTVALCAGVVVAFGSGGQKASATVVHPGSSYISAAYPSGRDRIVVGRDGSLRTALFRAAVAPGDIDRIIGEATTAGVGERLAPGSTMDLVFAGRTTDDAYRSVQSASFQPRLDLVVNLARVDGQLVGRTVQVAVDHTPLRVYGTFGQNLRASLTTAGLPNAAVDEYMRVLAAHVDIGTIGAGDRYDVIVQQDAAATGQRLVGGLMYAGLYQSNGMDLQLSQWTLGGKLRWFDAEEAAQSHDNIQRPVPGIVSSNYGSRMHPILGYTRMHKGLDFKAGYGTPILAAQTGWVRHAGWGNGYGQQVELTHGAGLSTTYSHMSQIVARQGTLVQQGQVIGYVGATGLATGPHLHYELHQNGVAIDPSTVKFTVGPQLRGQDLAGYKARLNALLAVHAAARPAQQLASR